MSSSRSDASITYSAKLTLEQAEELGSRPISELYGLEPLARPPSPLARQHTPTSRRRIGPRRCFVYPEPLLGTQENWNGTLTAQDATGRQRSWMNAMADDDLGTDILQRLEPVIARRAPKVAVVLVKLTVTPEPGDQAYVVVGVGEVKRNVALYASEKGNALPWLVLSRVCCRPAPSGRASSCCYSGGMATAGEFSITACRAL